MEIDNATARPSRQGRWTEPRQATLAGKIDRALADHRLPAERIKKSPGKVILPGRKRRPEERRRPRALTRPVNASTDKHATAYAWTMSPPARERNTLKLPRVGMCPPPSPDQVREVCRSI